MPIDCVLIGFRDMSESGGTSLKARHNRGGTGGTGVLWLGCARASLEELGFGLDVDIFIWATLGQLEAIPRSKDQQLEKERGSSTTTGLQLGFEMSTLHQCWSG
jgi:hypothetical protein